MMKHIRQLAEFKTGLEVRLGYPNEYLANETSEDLASPLYSTGIGLVIEGIAKYENDMIRGINDGVINTEIEDNDAENEPDNNEPKSEEGFMTKIITTFTKYFKQDNIR